MQTYDLVVVGAGSGGFGAALAASRLGAKVLLVEKSDTLGGTATRSGVNNWEPGVGGTGIPFELYQRMRRHPQAVGVYRYARHVKWSSNRPDMRFPGSELLIDDSLTYLDSLRRHGGGKFEESEDFIRSHWFGVPFEPDVCASAMERMLYETGHCEVLKNTSFVDAHRDDRRITQLTLSDGRTVGAAFFVDATADIYLAQALGCKTAIGQEARAVYNEPSAPLVANEKINGATLIYRISAVDKAAPAIDPASADIPEACWWAPNYPYAVFTQYPNGDFNVNVLPVMAGTEVLQLGYGAAYAECHRRIHGHWRHIQATFPEFQAYRISWIAPGLGVREGHRLVGRRVLTEHDLLAGVSAQTDPDIITIADHARDTHGADTGRAGCGELSEPYGVPFRCLLPAEVDNLAVACRGASLSSVAASSCRLSRTMMQFGQAVGTAVSLALAEGLDSLEDVSPTALRQSLQRQHVELQWPRSPEMEAYLRAL